MQIKHSDAELSPRPKALYRCYACRLELVLDLETNRLTIAPFHADSVDDVTPKTPHSS
jgi:hypothetical protein